MAIYDEIATRFKPPAPHYYLGVIGIDPNLHGRGFGSQLLEAFCDLSAGDSLSDGVYLETAQASNVGFYERAGFVDGPWKHRGRHAVVHVSATTAAMKPNKSLE